MKLIVKVKKHGQITEGLTFVGRIVSKIMLYLESFNFQYEGKVVRDGIEYRPTIPGLICSLFRVWFIRKKGNPSYDSK